VVGEINHNIEGISQLTAGTTQIAAQLNEASGNLQALSTQLDDLLGRFRL